jgi:arsenate reductase
MTPEPDRPNGVQRPIPRAFVSVPPKRVLFLCTHNSARSQIAEGLARKLAPAGTEIWSAGTAPSSVHPLALEVMAEAGIESDGQRSKTLSEVPIGEMDTIVSLCSEAEDACPVVGATVRRVHWPLDDPSSAPEADRLRAFRETRDELRWRVACLWPGNE